MAAKLTIGTWAPLPGSLPVRAEHGRVYIIPTRKPVPSPGSGDDLPRYTDHVRYLPKAARAAGVPVEFSLPEGSRKYLQEFSIDPETWALGLAALSMTSDWLIFTVSLFIDSRAKSQGWSRPEAETLPLKVSIVKMNEDGSASKTYEIEGSGADVIEALLNLPKIDLDEDKPAEKKKRQRQKKK